jgi:hypothetical protein
MLRIRVYLKELTRRGDAAARVAADAELRESALAIKLDPAGHRVSASAWAPSRWSPS